MRWVLVVVSVVAAPAVAAKDAQLEGVCDTLRQMAELVSEAETAARAAAGLGKAGLEDASVDYPAVVEARAAEAKALTLANEAADLSRPLVQSFEELCPSWLDPS
jgi:hypothetical protein